MTNPAALPSLSIVTPSLNQGRFIRATIESVLTQSYPRLEYRVQDGGSSDETLAVLREYGGRLAWESGPDGGQSDAINRALARTSGEVLGYLNSDDVLAPGTLETVGRVFAGSPAVQLVYGKAVWVDAEGREIGPCLTRAWDRRRLADHCFIAQPAAFFRRTAWEAAGPFDVGLRNAMDYDFWLRLAALFPDPAFRYVDRVLAAMRFHPDAKTVATWDHALDEVFAVTWRHTGFASLWWCVAKWDHRLDGRSQVTSPHPVPWRAYPPALVEFALRNRFRPAALYRGLRGAASGFAKRLGERPGGARA